uniref:ATP synthase subunit d, mitochondrial n=1 Tax=Cuerna arida TaxID=1464854 RepID=A0A1B6EXS6_9HEMI
MATGRFLQSKINWSDFSKRVPHEENTNFQSLKSKWDNYQRKMNNYPKEAPKIDWAKYSSRAQNKAALFKMFQERYEGLKVPYPANKVEPQLTAIEEEAKKMIADFKQESNQRISLYQKEIDRLSKMRPVSQMGLEEFADNFPELIEEHLRTFEREAEEEKNQPQSSEH